MGRKKSRSKTFLPKTLTSRVIPILKLIENNLSKAEICKILKISKQLAHYYCKKLLIIGFIFEDSRSSCVFYGLTQLGKNVLTRYESKCLKRRSVRLHNFVVGYPVLNDAEIIVDWKKVCMNNWYKKVGSFSGHTIERTPDKVIIYANVVEGDNPWELLYLAWRNCDSIIADFESRFKMLFGRGEIIRKPHFGVYGPLLSQASKKFELTTDIGRIDESKGSSEIDFFSPESTADYLLMPSRVARIEASLSDIKDSIDQHVAIVMNLKELAQTLTILLDNS